MSVIVMVAKRRAHIFVVGGWGGGDGVLGGGVRMGWRGV